MRLSFIKPRPKRLISWEIKVLLLFFTVISALLVGSFAFIKYQTYYFQESSIQAVIKKTTLDSERTKMQKQIDFIKIEANRARVIFTNNKLLSESIKNLFDIVPDKITLSKAQLTKDALTLYGKTPTKELYRFMLLAPLRSIFDRSYTSFYQLQNGWYNFVSTNYMDKKKVEVPHD